MGLPKNKHTDELFDAVMLLRDREECYRFFEDICTVKEVEAMAQRLYVAKLLSDGGSYRDAEEATGASSATISRINRCLEYGTGGYSLILKRTQEENK